MKFNKMVKMEIEETYTVTLLLSKLGEWRSFKQDSCPNEGQRQILSDKLGVDPLQINFWFQNKRNQQKVLAEYQFPSPLVPTRECVFLRFCKKMSDRCWAIVDFSLDSTDPCDARKCLRKPSGCIIEILSFEYLKVIWIENVEVDNSFVHNRYNTLVDSGLAFWCKTLGSDFEATMAERMVVNFSSVTGSFTQNCIAVSDMSIGNVRLVIRKSANDPTRPSSTVLTASTSFWLPFHPKIVYNILQDETTYAKVGILS
ncbi:homeobox-leucine zipper protein ROC1-like [Asparagus officinalis]|uniref:homeobox-leucine zipper protein ROC1-like n=1 Tax=Asparagus officinalis TaxID=4686 RepID=UPI00098E4F9E|nr:homeobox-leucine zipper protein ROC1-like [Asparagus officinalis]